VNKKKGNLKHSKRFTKSLKTLPREADLSEAKEAEDLAKELGIKGNGDDDLKAMIISRQKQRVSFLDGLEEKYGKKRSRNKRKRKPNMPSEEEFQRIQAKITKNKGS